MTLKSYMIKNNLTLKKLEAKVGIDFRTLSGYVSGRIQPSLKSAYKIYKKTNKQVKLKDWFEGDNK